MRFTELLNEAVTAEVYHSTSVYLAAKILQDGFFRLSNSIGNKTEQQYAPKGYPYFFSTSRSKVGDYHRFTGSSACMFVLDGNWLNQHYKAKAIDYWDGAWRDPNTGRTSESEDRVFSRTPTISIEGVKQVHVLLKEKAEYRSAQVRGILIQCKKLGLPVYLYTDESSWRLQNINRAVQPSAVLNILRGQYPKGYSGEPYQSIEPWLELIMKNKKTDLSPKGEKLRYNLVYYGYRNQQDDNHIANDFSNSRKPDSGGYDMANKVTEYMRKNKIPDLLTLKNILAKKWHDMSEAEYASK